MSATDRDLVRDDGVAFRSDLDLDDDQAGRSTVREVFHVKPGVTIAGLDWSLTEYEGVSVDRVICDRV